MAARGQESPFGAGNAEDLPFGTPDDQVSTVVDGSKFAEAKQQAMRAHATQISLSGPFFALSNNIGRPVFATEYYRLVRGELGSDLDADGREKGLLG
jgi:N-acetyl-1-D-myo-inositol-2-amino-2-deoxy-alpha-D-glucopyranoside deacetylase